MNEIYQQCPTLRKKGIGVSNAHSGKDLCLNCKFERCILEVLDKELYEHSGKTGTKLSA